MEPSSSNSLTPIKITPHSLDRYVEDLMEYKPVTYWTDYLISCGVGWICLYISLSNPIGSWVWIVSLTASGLGFYRAVTFIHEIIHFEYRKGILTGFPTFWNLTCGAFFFLPHFVYIPHRYHHTTEIFGTKSDPRYLPSIGKSRTGDLLPFLLFPIYPVLLIARFLILAPLSWILQGRFRKFVLSHASTLELNPLYERNIQLENTASIVRQEILVIAVWVLVGTGIYLHIIPLSILLSFYILYVFILSVNHIQTLAAHTYLNTSQKQMTFDEQIRDSITIEGPFLVSFLIMPVNIQYHSTHHIFPNMPYHSLRKAHYRLKAQLPPEHPYHHTSFESIFDVLSRVWNGTFKKE